MSCVVAFDPGKSSDAGFAAWGEDGPIVHAQGPYKVILAEWAKWVKNSSPRLVVIEQAFVGPNPKSSLVTAENAGFFRGVLWSLGALVQDPWLPIAGEWRKYHSFPGSRVDENGKRRRSVRADYEADARAFATAHTGVRFYEDRTHAAEALAMAAAGWERCLEQSSA